MPKKGNQSTTLWWEQTETEIASYKKKKQQKQDNKNGFENRKLRWRPVQEQLGSGLINVAQFRE